MIGFKQHKKVTQGRTDYFSKQACHYPLCVCLQISFKLLLPLSLCACMWMYVCILDLTVETMHIWFWVQCERTVSSKVHLKQHVWVRTEGTAVVLL